LHNSEKKANFVQQKNTKDNDGKTEENTKLRSVVGRSEQGNAIYKTLIACDSRGSDRTTKATGRSIGKKEYFLGKLEIEAKNNGTWIENIYEIADEAIAKGQENEVYLAKDGKNVIKVNNLSLIKIFEENFNYNENVIIFAVPS